MKEIFQRKHEWLKKAAEKKAAPPELLFFLERILKEREAFMRKLPSLLPSMEIKLMAGQGKEGFPLLDRSSIPWLSYAAEYFLKLWELSRSLYPDKKGALKGFFPEKPSSADSMISKFFSGGLTVEDLERDFGSAGSLLFFLLAESVRPLLETLSRQMGTQLERQAWFQGYCPFCEGLPGMGEIRGEEGKRVLHCQLCSTEWEYPRMKCPYCQNEDQAKLTYFQIEGELGYRVDICLQCQNYLKTADTREKAGLLDWEAEDYLTLHLDHLAQEEGYLRPTKLFVEIK